MRRLGIAALIVALWVAFLAVFVPASVYSGSLLAIVLALAVLLVIHRYDKARAGK